MISNDPCYKCEKRKVGCHSDCEDYITWAARVKDLNEAISRERNLNALAIGHVVNTIRRNRRRKNR